MGSFKSFEDSLRSEEVDVDTFDWLLYISIATIMIDGTTGQNRNSSEYLKHLHLRIISPSCPHDKDIKLIPPKLNIQREKNLFRCNQKNKANEELTQHRYEQLYRNY